MWFCTNCRQKVEKNILQDFQIEERCNAFMKKMDERMKKMEVDIESKCDEARVREIVTEVIGNSDQPEVEGESPEVVNSVLNEFEQRKLRENNIVLYGIEECDSKDKEVRSMYDTNIVKELLLICDLSEEEATPSKIFRVGKFDKDKRKRPLVASIKSQEAKKKIFKNFQNLKDSEHKCKQDFQMTLLSQSVRLNANSLRKLRNFKIPRNRGNSPSR